jgi:ABC-2 type transport system permease protein
MKKVKRYIHLYGVFIKNCLARELDFRMNFIVNLVDSFIWFVLSLLFFKSIYSQVPAVGGWSFEQTLLLVGTAQMIIAVYFTLFINNLPKLQKYVSSGSLDFILLKPCDHQFFISLRYFNMGGIANFVPSIILIGYALVALKIKLTFISVAAYIVLVISGILIGYAIWYIIMTLSIYVIKINALHELFLSTTKFIEYPISIYKGVSQFIMVFLLPMIIIANYPVQLLLGKISLASASVSILVSVGFMVVARIFWLLSVNKYQSASS